MIQSKFYRTEVRTDSDYREIPAVVEFSIDEATAKDIIRLAALVQSNDLYKVERFDWRARYLAQDPAETDPQGVTTTDAENHVRTEADTLNVCDTEFWFAAYLKHTDVKILSDRQSIDELAKHFGLEPSRVESGADRRPSGTVVPT